MSGSAPATLERKAAGDARRASKRRAIEPAAAAIDPIDRQHAHGGTIGAPALRQRSAATTGSAAPRDPATDLDDSRLTCLVGYAASRASIELKKSFARAIGPFGVKASEFSILMLLAANADVNQKQLGRSLEISPPNMAVTLDRMAGRGWIERVRSTRDRRSQQIHLTDAGRELVRKTEKISRSMEQSALAVLSEAERALLIELLLKVAAGRKALVRPR